MGPGKKQVFTVWATTLLSSSVSRFLKMLQSMCIVNVLFHRSLHSFHTSHQEQEICLFGTLKTSQKHFGTLKTSKKTLSNTSSLASRNSVEDSRHQVLNWRLHRYTNKARWTVSYTALVGYRFLTPHMIYGTYYMHLAIQRALVSCLLFYC